MFTKILVVFSIALTTLSIEAQAVQIDAEVGFGGKCRQGTWVPITINLKNPTNDTIAGTIATIDLITKQPSTHRTAFELGGPSEKQYTHYWLPDQPGSEAILKVMVDRGRVKDENKLIVKCPYQYVYPDNMFVTAVGPAQATLNFLDGFQLVALKPGQSGIPGSTSTQIRIEAGLIDVDNIPDRPLGYDGVDVLVLADLAPSRTAPEQLAAIGMWVASGGTLVVNGGADYQRLQNSFYEEMLPVKVTGARELSSLNSLNTIPNIGIPIENAASVVIESQLKPDARALVMQEGIPLVTVWDYGLGRVIFLAFDYTSPTLRAWGGQINMWKAILLLSSKRVPLASPIIDTSSHTTMPGLPPTQSPIRPHQRESTTMGSIESVAGNMPSITTPSLQIILIYLLAYLFCLVPVNYFILTRKNRRELAWITTPAVIILFTIGAYGIGYTMKGSRLLLNTISVTEASTGIKYAAINTYIGIFSPARRSYGMEIYDTFAVTSEREQVNANQYWLGGTQQQTRRRGWKPINVHFADTTVLPEISMDMWSMRSFRAESGCDLGGALDANLTVDTKAKKVTGRISNNTKYDLNDCQIFIGQQTAMIDNIRKNSVVEVESDLSHIGSNSIHAQHKIKLSELELDLLTSILNQLPTMPKNIIITAWSDQSPTPIKLKRGHAERQSANCFLFRVSPDGGQIK